MGARNSRTGGARVKASRRSHFEVVSVLAAFWPRRAVWDTGRASSAFDPRSASGVRVCCGSAVHLGLLASSETVWARNPDPPRTRRKWRSSRRPTRACSATCAACSPPRPSDRRGASDCTQGPSLTAAILGLGPSRASRPRHFEWPHDVAAGLNQCGTSLLKKSTRGSKSREAARRELSARFTDPVTPRPRASAQWQCAECETEGCGSGGSVSVAPDP